MWSSVGRDVGEVTRYVGRVYGVSVECVGKVKLKRDVTKGTGKCVGMWGR